jgi:FkbM family methyltransferase
MPSIDFHFRPDTYDIGIYRSIVIENEYRLPKSFLPDDIILDIGSHIGAFAYAVLVRGSHNVYAVEAEKENYQQSLRNLQPFVKLNHVNITCKAVWRSDICEGSVVFTGYYQPSHHKKDINTGGGSVAASRIYGCRYSSETVSKIETIAFDALVRQITHDGAKRIRLLKIDCEGSEWPILLTSTTLHLVDEICGEYHELGEQSSNRHPTFTIPGYKEYTSKVLVRFLQDQGFSTDHYPHGYQHEAIGMFFAKRT